MRRTPNTHSKHPWIYFIPVEWKWTVMMYPSVDESLPFVIHFNWFLLRFTVLLPLQLESSNFWSPYLISCYPHIQLYMLGTQNSTLNWRECTSPARTSVRIVFWAKGVLIVHTLSEIRSDRLPECYDVLALGFNVFCSPWAIRFERNSFQKWLCILVNTHRNHVTWGRLMKGAKWLTENPLRCLPGVERSMK